MPAAMEPGPTTIAATTAHVLASIQSRPSCPESSGQDRREVLERVDRWKSAGYPVRHRELLEDAARDARDAGAVGDWHVARAGAAFDARAAAWRTLQARDGCVVILGPRGTGKSQLAAELGLQAARKGLDRFSGSQQYRVLCELFSEEKRTYDQRNESRSSPLDAASRVDLLVLDEIQERFETTWEDRELTMLFDRRYRDMRRTILIANLTIAEAPRKLPASMWSRIVECGVVIECNWRSFRGARATPAPGGAS